MIGTRWLRSVAMAGAWLAPCSTIALAEGNPPPTASISRPDVPSRVPISRNSPASTRSDPGNGWWLGSVGIAAALAVFGGASLASKRFLPSRDSGPIRVVGRTSLSPKHSACLLRVGNRVLIVGFGPQGAPSTLGEIDNPTELARLAPRVPSRPPPDPKLASIRPSTGFDRRIGDDE